MQDVFALVPGAEIRALREESPNNLATLVYKAVEKLVKTVDSSCRTQREQQTGMYLSSSVVSSASLFLTRRGQKLSH